MRRKALRQRCFDESPRDRSKICRNLIFVKNSSTSSNRTPASIALDFTIKARKKARETDAHVTGQQLLEGVRQYALKQYGPMVPTVFHFWGVRRCEDFGDMVFNFIRAGVFGKSETDSVDDFKGGYSFHDAFIAPFLPDKPAVRRRVASDCPAEELR